MNTFDLFLDLLVVCSAVAGFCVVLDHFLTPDSSLQSLEEEPHG